MLDDEIEAITARGDQLKDGWYYVKEGEADPLPGHGPFKSRDDLMNVLGSRVEQKVYVIPITPELKKVVEEQGFPLFQRVPARMLIRKAASLLATTRL